MNRPYRWIALCTSRCMRRRNAPRLRGFSYLGLHRYSLTFCAHRREPVFTESAIVHPLVAQLMQTATCARFAVIVYCFMPDHLHVLAEGLSESSDLRALVHRWKQVSAFAWKHRTDEQLWQRGYFEHTLRDDEDVFAVARYLITNPLRAGLVSNVLDYPFIGSQTLALRDLVDSVQNARLRARRARS
jgi:putative transposase